MRLARNSLQSAVPIASTSRQSAVASTSRQYCTSAGAVGSIPQDLNTPNSPYGHRKSLIANRTSLIPIHKSHFAIRKSSDPQTSDSQTFRPQTSAPQTSDSQTPQNNDYCYEKYPLISLKLPFQEIRDAAGRDYHT